MARKARRARAINAPMTPPTMRAVFEEEEEERAETGVDVGLSRFLFLAGIGRRRGRLTETQVADLTKMKVVLYRKLNCRMVRTTE